MRVTICLTILVSTLVSASARAEASESQGDDAGSPVEHHHWEMAPRVDVTAAPFHWQPGYGLLAAFQRTAWLLRREDTLSPIPALLVLQDFERSRVADDALAGLGGSINLRPSWPTLKYQDADSNLSLTLAPGSTCTGACLKVMGSF